ncbi:hypothetical protein [Xanthomonas fragariae]|uniref:hypothetical protein n=1 Tax=Xanthomonas fragariae TaxID=48664 RepID=UPI0022AA485C|nr:hypothetical protein [Xanthomonas fragariae]WAT14133.1 hypothetical protein OZ429_13740 [Xanthomonas fragariae]
MRNYKLGLNVALLRRGCACTAIMVCGRRRAGRTANLKSTSNSLGFFKIQFTHKSPLTINMTHTLRRGTNNYIWF